MSAEFLPLVTPGEMLRAEFLKPMGISSYRLAKDIGVPLPRISAILNGKRAITADTALRLDRYFSLSEGYWLGIQSDYELRRTKRLLGEKLALVKPFRKDAGDASPAVA